jgi:hypothetical protein
VTGTKPRLRQASALCNSINIITYHRLHMKKLAIVIILLAISLPHIAQSVKRKSGTDSKNTTELSVANEPVPFQLFPTQNMWNFIKLDTRNGKMWQVQFDTKDNNRFETELNTISLIYYTSNEVPGRFTLYPTQNMFNFILLDQFDGRVWQVQWSIEKENRFILQIN